jgi:hypothetical protein
MRQRTIQKEEKTPPVKIDGMEDFPFEVVGLTVESIERSGGHIKIPIELMPFLKICRMPAITRKKKANEQHRYLLRLKAGKVKPYKDRKNPLFRKRKQKRRKR